MQGGRAFALCKIKCWLANSVARPSCTRAIVGYSNYDIQFDDQIIGEAMLDFHAFDEEEIDDIAVPGYNWNKIRYVMTLDYHHNHAS